MNMRDVTDTAPRLTHRDLGAQVLQAGLGNAAGIFYLSPLSMGVPGAGSAAAPARGGVPVLFPQFADVGPISRVSKSPGLPALPALAALPKHGLARTAHWRLLEDQASQGMHRLHYGLDIEPEDYPSWPHAARLTLVVEAKTDGLVFALQVSNSGSHSFSWTGGLHPYFAVQDVLTSSASGLAGLAVQDRYDADLRSQPPGDLGWTEQPFERLYDACPAVILDTGGYTLRLSASGFDQWMVWNPGEAGARALADVPAGDWRRFVCVEPVCVARPIVLEPGENFNGQLFIQVCRH
ncbi:MAG: D-hexose-6-phosphate mutarotase [Rhodoferax sp.]|nr:D-hexose-6-phosphate mutarotase [Rhodoferax sp.]